MVKQGIVKAFPLVVNHEEAQIKPHQIRYWLTPRTRFDAKVSNITSYIIALWAATEKHYVSMK